MNKKMLSFTSRQSQIHFGITLSLTLSLVLSLSLSLNIIIGLMPMTKINMVFYNFDYAFIYIQMSFYSSSIIL